MEFSIIPNASVPTHINTKNIFSPVAEGLSSPEVAPMSSLSFLQLDLYQSLHMAGQTQNDRADQTQD